MSLTEEQRAELRTMKKRVQALRRRLPGDGLSYLCDLLEEVSGYLVEVDDEIDELTSHIHYIEHLLTGKKEASDG